MGTPLLQICQKAKFAAIHFTLMRWKDYRGRYLNRDLAASRAAEYPYCSTTLLVACVRFNDDAAPMPLTSTTLIIYAIRRGLSGADDSFNCAISG